jgi:sensor histidine kinase regulating citrate/malate metabolism
MLEVVDDGSAVAEELVPLLFVLPIASETGLGVGLYQCRRLAHGAGYDVRLERNVDGEVMFACGPTAR